MFKLFRKKTETVESLKPETFKKQPKDDVLKDYNFGLNYQQLAEKYNLNVEDIAEIIG